MTTQLRPVDKSSVQQLYTHILVLCYSNPALEVVPTQRANWNKLKIRVSCPVYEICEPNS